jgi:hypothetical protein
LCFVQSVYGAHTVKVVGVFIAVFRAFAHYSGKTMNSEHDFRLGYQITPAK